MCTWRRLTVLLLVVFALPAGAGAQILPTGPITTAHGTVTVGGEATVTVGSRDDIAFFNYTDYEHNALRMFRVSLSGMWRPDARLAFLTELRSEDAQQVIPYALYVRVRPWKDHALDIQAGRIPPVFGAFARRSYGADNPLIGYPLAYQYLTSIRTDAVPFTADDLLAMRARGWRANYQIGVTAPGPGVPLVSAYRWDTGVQARAAAGQFEGAIALTNGTLSNPRVADDNRGRQVSARVAWKPVVGMVIGASAARGQFLTTTLENVVAAVTGIGQAHTQRALGLDAEYSRAYWIVRGELIDSRWDLPALAPPLITGPLWARAGFVETRYRFTPRFFAAARADRLTFSLIRGQRRFAGQPTPWDAPVTRIEAGGGVYLQRNLTVRLVGQRNWREAGLIKNRTFVSGQLAFWF
jgi:hypothetical protein